MTTTIPVRRMTLLYTIGAPASSPDAHRPAAAPRRGRRRVFAMTLRTARIRIACVASRYVYGGGP